MRLEEYLEQEGITRRAFAKKIGVNEGTIFNVINGKSPRLEHAKKIVEVTKGHVAYEDLLPCNKLKQGNKKKGNDLDSPILQSK